VAGGLGGNWGEEARPGDAARFRVSYRLTLVVATILVALGLDPLLLTNVSMALNAARLPLAVVPFLVLMNDSRYVGDQTNGRLSNALVLGVVALACVLAVVSLPLDLLGG